MSSTGSDGSPPSSLGPSPTRLRQIALVSADLKKAERLLTKVLQTEVVFVDPGVGQWGLENFLVAIGGDIVEVVVPTRPNTTAGRLLSRRGDGGYMIIMQTLDAVARRSYIESKGLSKVIYVHEHDDAVCIQYHPKGIKGGMMPELDSHKPSSAEPDPLGSRFSPWHPCGNDYSSYVAGMKRCSELHLVGAVCRLAPGDSDTVAAARQWEEIFGVPRMGDQLTFTNARMDFTKGVEGQPEGLVSITVAVEGTERMAGILDRAREEGLCGDGWINLVGVKWYFVPAGEGASRVSQGIRATL